MKLVLWFWNARRSADFPVSQWVLQEHAILEYFSVNVKSSISSSGALLWVLDDIRWFGLDFLEGRKGSWLFQVICGFENQLQN